MPDVLSLSDVFAALLINAELSLWEVSHKKVVFRCILDLRVRSPWKRTAHCLCDMFFSEFERFSIGFVLNCSFSQPLT